MNRLRIWALLLLASTAGNAAAQKLDPPALLPPDAMIEAHLRARTAEVSARPLDGARTRGEWESRRPRLHAEFLDMLGLWPLPEKSPLRQVVTGTVDRGAVVVEKVHFQSRPGLFVTGNLYRAKAAKGKAPGVLYVCGHSGRGRDGNKTAFQDHGMWFARNGYVCLVVDTLQLGEVAGKHHGTYNLGRWWWHSAGYTPAGVECWNGIRALDYLATRPEVDAERLGVTGISGGGAVTVWVAAADPRVKVAVPVSGMSDLESYVSNKVINGHCDCMFVVNSRGWEWATLAALIAPRPLLFANSDDDRIFPMDGNRRVMARLRTAYKLFDKEGLVEEYVSKGGHDYRPDLRLAVFRFFDRHLLGARRDIEDATDAPLPGADLRVFPADKDLPPDASNARIDESFVPRARLDDPPAGLEREWVGKVVTRLRERSFQGFPGRVEPAEPVEFRDRRGGISGEVLASEPGVGVLLSRPVQEGKDGRRGVVVILTEGDEDRMEVPAWAAPHVKGAEVRLLVVRGGPGRGWTRKNPPNYVERASALLGRTVDTGRVWDVAAVVRSLTPTSKLSWEVCGRGPAGVLGAYAALLEPDIRGVIAVEPPASHVEGPHFLGVLRTLDVPDALALVAPRPVTLVGAKGPAWARTEALAKKFGGKVERR